MLCLHCHCLHWRPRVIARLFIWYACNSRYSVLYYVVNCIYCFVFVDVVWSGSRKLWIKLRLDIVVNCEIPLTHVHTGNTRRQQLPIVRQYPKLTKLSLAMHCWHVYRLTYRMYKWNLNIDENNWNHRKRITRWDRSCITGDSCLWIYIVSK